MDRVQRGVRRDTDCIVVPSGRRRAEAFTWHPGPDSGRDGRPPARTLLFTSTRASAAPSAAANSGLCLPRAASKNQWLCRADTKGDFARWIAHRYRMNKLVGFEERRNYSRRQIVPIWIVDLKSYDRGFAAVTDSKTWTPHGSAKPCISFPIATEWRTSGSMTRKRRNRPTHQVHGFHVKTLDSSTDAVVFEQAGYIHELDPKSGKAHIVNISAAGDFPWMMPAGRRDARMDQHCTITRRESASRSRRAGRFSRFPRRKANPNISHSAASAEIDAGWSPDGKYISYFSDKSGSTK